jgi:hypothetical protein
MTAPALVYLFCLLACGACAALLVRYWLKTRTRLLMWSAISFIFLAANNLFLFADTTLFPDVDLGVARVVSSVLAISVLIFGLIWEAE